MAAAQAITMEQRAVLVKEMSQALDYVIYGKDASRSSAHTLKNSNPSQVIRMKFQVLTFSYFLNAHFTGASFILIFICILLRSTLKF